MTDLIKRLIAGLLAGLIGGTLFFFALGPFLTTAIHFMVSALLGLLFGALIGPKLRTGGASLVWGEAYGLIWWLVGYLTLIPITLGDGLYWQAEQIQQLFPLLLGQIIAYGAALGLSYYGIMRLLGFAPAAEGQPKIDPTVPRTQQILAPRLQSLLIGGIGGLLGGLIFLLGIERAAFFPLVAGIVRSDSAAVGQLLHYLIALTIGVSFGLLFYRDIRGAGSAIVWGMTYGISWWMLGPMTLRPLLSGSFPDWSLEAAQRAFTPLISHILYGALVGLFYALATKLWNILFVDSDPLNRTQESAGATSLRGLLMGQVAGLVGGLLFTIVMVSIGALPRVASLVGGQSAVLGFLVHCAIAFTVGSTYGLLFQKEAYSYGSGMGWGLLYGFLWWLLGPNTLFFVLLRQPVDWSLLGVVGRYSALVGHMLFGLGLGLAYQYLLRRYAPHPAHETAVHATAHTAGTPAAALWAVTLLIGTLLPLLLGVG